MYANSPNIVQTLQILDVPESQATPATVQTATTPITASNPVNGALATLATLGIITAGAGAISMTATALAKKREQDEAKSAQMVTLQAQQSAQAQSAGANWAENQAMQANAKQAVVTQVTQSQVNKDFWVAYADWQRKAIFAEQKRKLIQILSQNTSFIDEIKSRIQTLLSQYGIRLSGVSLNQVKIAGLSHIYRFLSNFTPGQNPTNFGNKNQGEYFTYWNQRIGLAPVLPDIDIEITRQLVLEYSRNNNIDELLINVGANFSFEYLIITTGESLQNPENQQLRLNRMRIDASRAYITIDILGELLGYTPSYTQLLGSMWFSEGSGRETSSIQDSNILLTDDLERAIAHQLNSYCLKDGVSVGVYESRIEHFLYALGSYWQAFYNIQPTLSLLPHVNREVVITRGESIIQHSIDIFTKDDPFHYGELALGRGRYGDPLRTYNLTSFESHAIWSGSSWKYDPIQDKIYNTTIGVEGW